MDTDSHDPNHPRSLTDMAGAAEWNKLRELVATNPHIILAGSAGSGKSCAIRHILGSSIVFWLRCTQDPSLRDSRDKIKNSARKRIADNQTNWIVLEHADALHADAQAFLRRIIETSTGSSRFVLEVRDVAAIAEPILSRTVLFNCPTLLPHEISSEIRHRSPSVSMETSKLLAAQSKGNIRWAILQGLGSGDGMIEPSMTAEVTDWNSLLHTMEEIQRTGTSPRALLNADSWDRPGGICPWAITAWTLCKSIPH